MNPDPLPARYARFNLGDLRTTPGNEQALGWAKDWISGTIERSQGLVLVGDPGTGKTAIACALAGEAIDLGLDVGFTTAANLREGLTRQIEIMDLIRRLPNLDEDDDLLLEHTTRHDTYFEYAHEAPLLVLDDLGRERSSNRTQFIEGQIDNLIRNRGDNALATIVTTNLTKTERVSRYGEAMESYLHGVCDFIQVDGGDWRRGEG